MPLGFVVNKDSKMRSAIAGSMPAPVSLTATSTPPGSMRSEDIVSTLARSMIALMASLPFMIRLSTTCCI